MRRYSETTLFVLALITLLSSCVEIKNELSGIPPGIWRAELILSNNPYPVYDEDAVRERRVAVFDGIEEDKLPFLMEISYPQADSFVIDIINGEEKIRVQEYQMALDRSTAYDTIRIKFPEYNSYIHAEFKEEVLQGEFVDRNRGNNYRIPFVAKYGENNRFSDLETEPATDLSGSWAVTFGKGNSEWKAVGEFEQNESQLSGTFLTETGDLRFLEGVVYGDEMWLSTFDGTHAYLFKAKLQGDSLSGFYKSGSHYKTSWVAHRTKDANFKSPDSLSKVIDATALSQLSGIHPESGEMIRLSDPKYADRPIVLSIMGSWCPNCKDEALFLSEWLESNKDTEVEVIGLAFEKYKDTTEVLRRLEDYRALLDLPYDIWFMGSSDKQQATERLGFLNEVISYPTLIFLNRQQEVVRVHTGFNGPATSKYNDFKVSFEETIKQIK